MCTHTPACPPANAPDHCAARVVAAHYDQGWSLLCNGVVLFCDYGELLPDGAAVAPPPCGDRRDVIAINRRATRTNTAWARQKKVPLAA